MASCRSTSPRAVARRVAQLTMLAVQLRIDLREVKPHRLVDANAMACLMTNGRTMSSLSTNAGCI